ncbi:glyceraldehyde-3-phosphate dehydrogenase [Frigoribacterium faeni]|uniref:Glyceraldehyde-3-phosphate dehydrogenase n=1 Tax=Frigoribacterium faeni TaxID=145483 RepID=A0A7W3PJ61_9MICO|nr:glyceraldehyde-3-phosphate dehydrogenase [Frigoribacterium faeni]MBA8813733.1 glyceraldehyde 3-phosphate dehydrogenase [Frigoribacterium faeni]BFF15033.1 glyceraldehyde-3-phosphate dehydrogenase [Microbacterium flavescens]GEK83380.1 glyceraldehyde-3-phosphate dehydrogenase [Frigoribacterium faeni]
MATSPTAEVYEHRQRDWSDRVALAESMIPLIGRLHRRDAVVVSIHGRSLLDRSPVAILKAHRFARQLDDLVLDPEQTLEVLRLLDGLALGPASIDLARLSARHRDDPAGRDLADVVRAELAEIVGRHESAPRPGRDVVLYGFGRIGRLVARLLIEHAGGDGGLRLRAVVVRRGSSTDLAKRASLLRRDSIHGPFAGTITVDEATDTIVANGTTIQVIYSDDPATVDYGSFGIHDAIVVDNTGRWRDEPSLRRHLEARGASRVLLTAPGKGSLPNVVFGVNHEAAGDHEVVAAASCTTNAITPVLAVVDERWGIESGHIETVHAVTNDQNLTDNFHPGDRRGRSAALNMVLTETGAATAVAKALPGLAGRLTGSAIRVPTADVSVAVLNLRLRRPADRAELNAHLRRASLDSPLRRQIDYIESPEVASTDFVGSRHAGVVDGLATVVAGDSAVLYVWYDNEFGYSCQVVRLLEHLAGGTPPSFPRVASAESPAPGREGAPRPSLPDASDPSPSPSPSEPILEAVR